MLVAPLSRRRLRTRFGDAGHDLRAAAGTNLGVVLLEADITDPVQSDLDRPVPPQPGREVMRLGLLGGQIGDRVHGFGAPLLTFQLWCCLGRDQVEHSLLRLTNVRWLTICQFQSKYSKTPNVHLHIIL